MAGRFSTSQPLSHDRVRLGKRSARSSSRHARVEEGRGLSLQCDKADTATEEAATTDPYV